MGASRLCLGVITGAHGLHGAVRVRTFTATPRAIADYGTLEDRDHRRRFKLRLLRADKNGAVVRLDGVLNRDQAEALKGVKLFCRRNALPKAADEDEFYHADLIGLAALDMSGARVGTVRALHDFGAGDVIEILPDDGGPPQVLPFTRKAVPVIDLAAGTVSIDPPEGL